MKKNGSHASSVAKRSDDQILCEGEKCLTKLDSKMLMVHRHMSDSCRVTKKRLQQVGLLDAKIAEDESDIKIQQTLPILISPKHRSSSSQQRSKSIDIACYLGGANHP